MADGGCLGFSHMKSLPNCGIFGVISMILVFIPDHRRVFCEFPRLVWRNQKSLAVQLSLFLSFFEITQKTLDVG
jgi:hypothetical protein